MQQPSLTSSLFEPNKLKSPLSYHHLIIKKTSHMHCAEFGSFLQPVATDSRTISRERIT